VIVTGAGNGLGRTHALLAARCGANVVVNDVGGSNDGTGSSDKPADFVVEEIRAAGGTAIADHGTVATDEGCRSLADAALAEFGRIDAVIHNAGILRNASIGDMTDEQFFPVLQTHLLGGFYLTRAVFPTMAAQHYGRFVYTSSAVGVWGRPGGSANYGISKAGLVGLCNAVGHEGEAIGIRANAVMPLARTRIVAGGPDDHDRSPEAAAAREARDGNDPRGMPDWVSPLVIYLASEQCTVNRRSYSSGMGRYARIFIGVTSGWYAPDGDTPTPDDIADHLASIEDRTDYDLPDHVFHEIELLRARHPGATRR
jgi:NAD(P)-dependent dehydrogenase (short-subunit alcohol dehydrogenase family)